MPGAAPDLLTYANATIDTGRTTGPVNRVTHELTELAPDLAVVEAFSHVWAVRTEEGLVLFDVSGAGGAGQVLAALRRWCDDPVHTVVVTHGHMDHIGGAAAFIAEAAERGRRRPRFVGHENIAPRLARYRMTNGYNQAINQRQFAPGRKRGLTITGPSQFVPEGTPDPDETHRDGMTLEVGGQRFGLRHDKGETDDHTWTEWEGRGVLFVGDFLIWNFPNCGNPQKVLRFPAEWAAAMRKMAARSPELVAPAHGLPVSGPQRADRVLGSVADALEALVGQVIAILNADGTLDEALHTVRVPDAVLSLPWMRPFYDEPEFVVRNIWRTYGGWWDRNPAKLHPAREHTLALEVVALAGGVAPLVTRARTLAEEGDLRTAGELIEMATTAHPDDLAAQAARAEIYARRRSAATSLMAKGVYQEAAQQSADRAGIELPVFERVSPLS
jgi:glyoxylase-like metal-dependent hydrolase (beta-lactamase superfamily II)